MTPVEKRDPVIQFFFVLLLSPLCAIVGEAVFGKPGLRLGWLSTLWLVSIFSMRGARSLWKGQPVFALWQWPGKEPIRTPMAIGMGVLSGLTALIALGLLVKWTIELLS